MQTETAETQTKVETQPELEDKVNTAQDEPRTETVDQKALMERLEQLESTNGRLLEENKRHSARRKKAEEDKLLAEGKKDEVIQKLRQEVDTFREKDISNAIAMAVAEEAERRGCKRWDHLFKVTDGDGVDYDEETGQVLGVKDFFDRYEGNADYGFYFQKESPVSTENRTPSQGAVVDYRNDPVGYARAAQKKGQVEYEAAVNLLRREGLLR